MKKVRIVQYGVTHEHAVGKIDALRLMSDVYEIVGVVDDRSSKTARFPQEVPMEHFEGLPLITPEEFFARKDVEAVAVEVTNDDLMDAAMRCLEKGIAMHVDKPGGTALEPFDTLVRECEKKQIPFQMGYMFRGNTALNFCLDAVHKGLLGDVFEVQMDMNHCYGGEPYVEYLKTFSGGLMYNLCCHLIDFVVQLMGKPEKIFSILKNTADSPADSRNNCLAVLEYPNAMVTLRSCSKDYDPQRRVRIAGTNGVIDIPVLERLKAPLRLTMTLKHAAGDFPAGRHDLAFQSMDNRYSAQLLELARIIRKEIPNRNIYQHDRLVNRVNLACAQLADWNQIKNF